MFFVNKHQSALGRLPFHEDLVLSKLLKAQLPVQLDSLIDRRQHGIATAHLLPRDSHSVQRHGHPDPRMLLVAAKGLQQNQGQASGVAVMLHIACGAAALAGVQGVQRVLMDVRKNGEKSRGPDWCKPSRSTWINTLS